MKEDLKILEMLFGSLEEYNIKCPIREYLVNDGR